MDNVNSDVRYSVLREKSSDWQPDNEIELNPDAVFIATTTTTTTKPNDQNKSSTSLRKSGSPSRKLPDHTEMEPMESHSSSTTTTTTSSTARGSIGVNKFANNNNNNSSPRVSLPSVKATNNGTNPSSITDPNLSQLPGIQYLNTASLAEKLKKRRTLLEKILFGVILLMLVVILIMLITLFSLEQQMRQQTTKGGGKTSNQSDGDYCNSYRCILVSGSMYKSINKKIDPCDDFYEYSCGGWIKKNLIPTGFPRWGTLNLITYENQLLIKDQLEANRSLPSEITEAETKARTFYRSCLDRDGVIEKLGGQPLKAILGKFVFKSPDSKRLVINETFDNLLTLIQVTYGLNSLFEFNVLDDDKNSTFSNIEIIQGSLGLDRSFYINNSSEKNLKAMEIYKKTIVNVINLLFENVSNANEQMENLIKFETSLAKIMLPTEKLSEVESIYSRVKIGDLRRKHATFFDWKTFFNRFLRTYGSPEVLTDDDEIIIMGLDYFVSLNELINEYKQSGREDTLKLSVIFHLIKFSLPLLSKEYRSELTALGEALTGSITVERWQTCIEHTDNIFGLGYAITRMFIRASPNNAKIEAQKMIKSIKNAFVENFPKIAWMDNETRQLAEEKVNSVDDLIGYPDFIENDELLNARYRELAVKEDDYFGNEIRLVQYALKSEIMTYRTRVNRAEWEMTSSAVNAYYSPTRNQIVFPSGILQDPFFHPENPMSINYGSIGTIMGHELTHGFDDSGREYDKSGMMKQWWNNETIENFKNASKCMIKQYSDYKVEGECLNGKQTLGENIADNGGLRSAYYAYEKWIRENGEEKPLPLLGLTHRQLFFLSFAQTWCSKSTADSLHLSLSVDQHSPPRFRVIGTVSNSVEFAKAFNCPANSPMNPTEKCKIW